MVFKNLFIFGAGVLIGVVAISLISAYYMFNSVRNYNLPKDVQFTEKGNKVEWNPPESFREALETWYTVLIWHLSGNKASTVYRSEERAKFIFITVILLFIIIVGIAMWFSFDIQAMQKVSEMQGNFMAKIKNLHAKV
jgi:hypothetical protein